jgi:hypothetical protein
MSYCRFSCLNGYALLMAGGADPGHPASALWAAQRQALHAWADANEPVAIDHPEAGTSFNHDTPGECADNLERLRASGLIVPHWAIDDLRSEQIAPEDRTSGGNVSKNSSHTDA